MGTKFKKTLKRSEIKPLNNGGNSNITISSNSNNSHAGNNNATNNDSQVRSDLMDRQVINGSNMVNRNEGIKAERVDPQPAGQSDSQTPPPSPIVTAKTTPLMMPQISTTPPPPSAPSFSRPWGGSTGLASYTHAQSSLSAATGTQSQQNKFYPPITPFTWEVYLEISPAPLAPKQAFKQALVYPLNLFQPGMKLEARDPRSINWCLCTVVAVEGLHIRIRFDGTDTMNDHYEIIDSDNIRPIGSAPEHMLLAPYGYKNNIAQYTKFVEKALRSEQTIIAPPENFPPTPPSPPRNLFEPGMKLEAIDRKNRHLIFPATVGEVDGDMLSINFDNWNGSFDYKCPYTSRDIFPVNWCRDVGHSLQEPNCWKKLLEKGKFDSPNKTRTPEPRIARSSSFLGSTKATTSQTTPRKRRGRPKKAPDSQPTPIKTNGVKSRPSAPLSKEIATPDNNITYIDGEEPSASPNDPEYLSATNEDMSPSMVNDRYRCQRTKSYEDWKLEKLRAQMPQSLQSDTNNPGDVINSSLNLSDTTSLMSTLSRRRDSLESSDLLFLPEAKRTRVESQSHTNISEQLEQVLKTKPRKLSTWSVDDVLDIIGTESSLVKYTGLFQDNEIDGKAFALIGERRTELLMSMGLKMGPVLKVLNLRELVESSVDTSDVVR